MERAASRDAGRLSAGGSHVCYVKADGTVACWGHNFYGELGDGTFAGIRAQPTEGVGLTAVVAVAAGLRHTCAVRFNGTVFCWGGNTDGQLGDGTTQSRNTPVQVPGVVDAGAVVGGFNHTCALRATGGVLCWGRNDQGQLGGGTTEPRAAPVAASQLVDAASISAGRGRLPERSGPPGPCVAGVP